MRFRLAPCNPFPRRAGGSVWLCALVAPAPAAGGAEKQLVLQVSRSARRACHGAAGVTAERHGLLRGAGSPAGAGAGPAIAKAFLTHAGGSRGNIPRRPVASGSLLPASGLIPPSHHHHQRGGERGTERGSAQPPRRSRRRRAGGEMHFRSDRQLSSTLKFPPARPPAASPPRGCGTETPAAAAAAVGQRSAGR